MTTKRKLARQVLPNQILHFPPDSHRPVTEFQYPNYGIPNRPLVAIQDVRAALAADDPQVALNKLGIVSADSGATLNEYLNHWTVTSFHYRSLIDQYIRPDLGHYRLKQLSKDAITAWVNGLKSVKKPTEGLAVGTKRRVLRCLHKVLADAVEAHRIAMNPADGVKVLSDGDDEGDVNPFTEEELATLLEANTAYRDYYAVLAWTGLRRGELIGLRRKDFRRDRETGSYFLIVERSYDARTHKMRVCKNREKRRVDLWPDTAKIISARLRESGQPDDIIFAGKAGRPVNPTTLTHAIRDTLPALGLAHHRLHDLRHTHATMLLASGWGVVDVANRLGHKDPSVTLRVYAHCIPGHQAGLIAAKPNLAKAQSNGTVFEPKSELSKIKWAILDSNQRPQSYQDCALTN